jgi:hypothetical protein
LRIAVKGSGAEHYEVELRGAEADDLHAECGGDLQSLAGCLKRVEGKLELVLPERGPEKELGGKGSRKGSCVAYSYE